MIVMTEELEQLIDQKVKPLLDEAMHKNLGITVSELENDISDRLKRIALLEFDVDTKLKFKEAKSTINHILELHLLNIKYLLFNFIYD